VIKPYLIESSHEDEDNEKIPTNSDHENQVISPENDDALTRPTRARRLPRRYQHVTDITIFLQDEDQLDASFSHSSSSHSTLTFVDSRRKEINDLLKNKVFEMTIISEVSENVRIFNS
jgi:hypothetical protein